MKSEVCLPTFDVISAVLCFFPPTSCVQLTVLKPSCRSLGSSSARACLALSRAGRMTSFHRVVWRPTISWMLLNSLVGSTSVSRLLSCRFSSQHRNSCRVGEQVGGGRFVRLRHKRLSGSLTRRAPLRAPANASSGAGASFTQPAARVSQLHLHL